MTPTPVDPFAGAAGMAIELIPILLGVVILAGLVIGAFQAGRRVGGGSPGVRTVTRKEVSIEEATRADVRGSDRYKVLYDALSRLLLATDYPRNIFPESLTKNQYRGVIAYAVGVEKAGMSTFNKRAIIRIAEALEVPVSSEASTREIRAAIADRWDIDYDPTRTSHGYRKSELVRLAEVVVDRRTRGLLDLEETDEEGGE